MVIVINQAAIIDNIADAIDMKTAVQRSNSILEKVKVKLAMHTVVTSVRGTGSDDDTG